MQVKNSTQLYSKLLVRALSHQDLRMRLAAMIAIAEAAIDNLSFQMKLVAWSCYTIVNICANCIPNILLLKDIVPSELEILNDAIQMEIWCYVWRENYAQTIVEFADRKLISNIICNAIQPKSYIFENHHEQTSNRSSLNNNNRNSSNRMSSSVNYQRCTIL
ncbi:unnamed protein product [Rotaria sordida]|uniref:Uncharacterized protein n=2 Tax=Rotaria sordida TaxID=392033 RepID=A0A814ARG2_9BILA|nr:unnamed protein product [Rotaria sordida]